MINERFKYMKNNRKSYQRVLAAMLAATVIVINSVCALASQSQSSQNTRSQNQPTLSQGNRVEQMLSSMTLEEKVGQMFIVRPDFLDAEQVDSEKNTGVTCVTKQAQDNIQKYNIGGVCIFRKNITDPEQLKQFTGSLQVASSIGMFISIDEEGGRIARIANSDLFPVPKVGNTIDIGATADTPNACNAAATIGSYLREYGLNVDFAPVADVNTNPNNIVIGNRAFGSDPTLVANMVSAQIQGFHSQGIMTCAKHFPGHGDTSADTHTGYVAVSKDWNQMLGCEIKPFKNAINSGTDFVMVAHIVADNVSHDGLPASLSPVIVTDKLKNELGFGGIVITDAMEMGAIHQNYTDADSAVLAVKAGIDIILMPYDFESAYNSVVNAVRSGEISRERIDDSVRRILTVKEKYGLLK